MRVRLRVRGQKRDGQGLSGAFSGAVFLASLFSLSLFSPLIAHPQRRSACALATCTPRLLSSPPLSLLLPLLLPYFLSLPRRARFVLLHPHAAAPTFFLPSFLCPLPATRSGGAELLVGGVRKHEAALPDKDTPCKPPPPPPLAHGLSRLRARRPARACRCCCLGAGGISAAPLCSAQARYTACPASQLGLRRPVPARARPVPARRRHTPAASPHAAGKLGELLVWIKDNLLKERPELFIFEGTV